MLITSQFSIYIVTLSDDIKLSPDPDFLTANLNQIYQAIFCGTHVGGGGAGGTLITNHTEK